MFLGGKDGLELLLQREDSYEVRNMSQDEPHRGFLFVANAINH